jgi:hypothetical protein
MCVHNKTVPRYVHFISLNVLLAVHHSTVYQYSETNVMHFLFSLLGIKRLYMFRALLAYPQEALHKRHLVYCVHFMSVGCTRIEVELHGVQRLLRMSK